MKKILFVIISTLILSGSSSAKAFTIETLDNPIVQGDFVLGPGKTELFLNPGESYAKDLTITNRLGKKMDFKIEIEDFEGSKDPEQAVSLLGDARGPYSLKDYIKPEVTSFTLEHNQRIILPVKISIPADAEPGGLYGSVLVTSSPFDSDVKAQQDSAQGQARLVSRVGTLFFIRVNGKAREEGSLKSFTLKNDRIFFDKGPIPLTVLFENTGSVHLMPQGTIEIQNFLDRKVGEIKIDPWFVLPGSARSRAIEWSSDNRFMIGHYTAIATISRGYGNLTDQKKISFWIIPWKILVSIILAIFFFLLIVRWIKKEFNFEVKRKKVSSRKKKTKK